MPPDFTLFFLIQVVSAISTLVALVFAFKLYRETDRGWYWFALLLSAIFFAVSGWIGLLAPILRRFEVIMLVRDISEIFGGLLFGLACYGIYKTMMEVRKRME